MLPYEKNLKQRAHEMRKKMTPAEKKLWYDFLSSHPLQFYRQRIIHYYIADFYCHQAKLVIEVDGAQHHATDAIEYDQIRTDSLSSMDIAVIRFDNDEIMTQFRRVCNEINQALQERLSRDR